MKKNNMLVFCCILIICINFTSSVAAREQLNVWSWNLQNFSTSDLRKADLPVKERDNLNQPNEYIEKLMYLDNVELDDENYYKRIKVRMILSMLGEIGGEADVFLGQEVMNTTDAEMIEYALAFNTPLKNPYQWDCVYATNFGSRGTQGNVTCIKKTKFPEYTELDINGFTHKPAGLITKVSGHELAFISVHLICTDEIRRNDELKNVLLAKITQLNLLKTNVIIGGDFNWSKEKIHTKIMDNPENNPHLIIRRAAGWTLGIGITEKTCRYKCEARGLYSYDHFIASRKKEYIKIIGARVHNIMNRVEQNQYNASHDYIPASDHFPINLVLQVEDATDSASRSSSSADSKMMELDTQ